MKLYLFEYKYNGCGDVNGGGIVFIGNSLEEFSHASLITDKESLMIHEVIPKCELIDHTYLHEDELLKRLKETSSEPSYLKFVKEIGENKVSWLNGRIGVSDLARQYKLQGGLFLIKEMEIGEQTERGIIADFSTPIE